MRIVPMLIGKLRALLRRPADARAATLLLAPCLAVILSAEVISSHGFFIVGHAALLVAVACSVSQLRSARGGLPSRALRRYARIAQAALVSGAAAACMLIEPAVELPAAVAVCLIVLCEVCLRIPLGLAYSWTPAIYLLPVLCILATRPDRLDLAASIALVWVAVACLQGLRRHGALQMRGMVEQLRQAKGTIESVSRQNAQMILEAGHDLREPVHALGMMIDQLDPSSSAQELKRRIAEVRITVSTVSDMLADLLDLSRLHKGDYVVDVQPVNMHLLCEDIERTMAPMAAAKGVSLVVKSARVWALSDAGLLRRIVQNLVTNALKYTSNGAVALTVAARENAVILKVRDTGRGIPQEKINEIFNDYVRLQPEGPESGLGIGLGVVRRATRLLQHPLWVKSKLGVGSEFGLELPLVNGVQEVAKAIRASASANWEGKLVLLVENDPLLRSTTKEVIASTGATVYSFASAEEALSIMSSSQQPLDALVTDYHLDGVLDGLQLIERVRDRRPQTTIPAVLLTGDLSPSLQQLARRNSVRVAYKPVRPQRLREILSSALAGQPLSEPMHLN